MIERIEQYLAKVNKKKGFCQYNGVHGQTRKKLIAYLKKTKKLYNNNWIKNTSYDGIKIVTTPEFASLERRLFNLEKKLTTALYR
jgi:hypothetical protein